jgi:hypothetical protein
MDTKLFTHFVRLMECFVNDPRSLAMILLAVIVLFQEYIILQLIKQIPSP